MVRSFLDLSHLGELPDPLEPDELERVVENWIKNGCEDSRQEIILTHLRLAVSYAARFTYKCPRKEDDFVEVAFYLVIEAVDRFRRTGKDCSITPYINTTLWYGLLKELVEGRPVKLKEDHRVQELITIEQLKNEPTIEGKEKLRLEIREVFELCARTNEEQLIVMGLLQGFTQREIAEHIERSPSYVSNLLGILLDRFRHYWSYEDD